MFYGRGDRIQVTCHLFSLIKIDFQETGRKTERIKKKMRRKSSNTRETRFHNDFDCLVLF